MRCFVTGKAQVLCLLAILPLAASPTKPEAMSEEEHASHHGAGSEHATETVGKAQSIGTLYLIDAEARRLLRQIDVPGGVHHVLVTPDGLYAIATHPGRGSVSVVDIHGHKLHKELPTGPAPNYAVAKRDGTRVYVSNAGNGTISEIDTATTHRRAGTSALPRGHRAKHWKAVCLKPQVAQNLGIGPAFARHIGQHPDPWRRT